MKNLIRIFVIHNLKEYERKSQVENYIKEILLNSSTFNIESSTEINKDKNESTWKYFYEPNSNPKIFHLIFAKEGTEAGEFYNQDSINYILNKTSDITDRRSFNIINSIKDTFCLVSESILEEPLKKEEDILLQDKKIKLNSNKEKHIKLKKCLIDEIGFSNFLSNGFEPKYEYYIKDDKLIISLEMPGEYKKTKYAKESKGSYTYIKISGTKVNDNEENLKNKEQKENSFNNKEYGEFNTTIKLENISLDAEKAQVDKKDGITTFFLK
jgi:HSP20 family molecular chaperone IbpA